MASETKPESVQQPVVQSSDEAEKTEIKSSTESAESVSKYLTAKQSEVCLVL